MPNPNLPRQIRLVLESTSDAPPVSELTSLVDEFVHECAAAADTDLLVFQLEEELQNIHHEIVDYSSLYQIDVFLDILYHLGPVLSCNSVISWFDLVLRPALREPKLPTTAVNHAKDLIISALQKTADSNADKLHDFRRRLMELYLLDAYNESSGTDVLEWAELDEEQKEKRTRWKANLEDILLKYGRERPEELMAEINAHFGTPSSRFQLITFLNTYTVDEYFTNSALVLAKHPLMENLLLSLFLDYSSTVCTSGLSLLVKLLPHFAVHARDELKAMLPKLLAILGRIMCWKSRPPSDVASVGEEIDVEFEKELEIETNRVLRVRPGLEWNRLEMTFNATSSSPPKSRPYFTALYYLYPSNALKFLRAPVSYIVASNLLNPYEESWEKALDQDEIRRRSENLLREHVCHPLLVWRDAVVELSEPEFWIRYSVSRIASETFMLDVRNHAIGLRERYRDDIQALPDSVQRSPASSAGASGTDSATDSATDSETPTEIHPLDLSSGRPVISLQEMVNAYVALKSNQDIEIIGLDSQWPHELFSHASRSPVKRMDALPILGHDDSNAVHVAQAVSSLQREVLLLRNELNFELWLSRENAKHIARLYQDRILIKSAEAERQGLYNKLRKYRAQVIALETELREHKQQASSAKNKYADWNTELQKKLKELREEKKSWISQTAALRSAEKQAQALFTAQGKLLEDATKQVFDLQTQKKENQHKLDRLQDYERQIEQHLKVQRLWDADFAKFTEREEEIKMMQTEHKKMELRLDSFEKTQIEMDDAARIQRRQVQTLEAQLEQARRKLEKPRLPSESEIAEFASEKATLQKANKRLAEENNELKDEIEEMRAMLEVLKGQHSGRKGVVTERRASPQ